MKAKLTILEKSNQKCIQIVKDNGVEDELWDGIIEHCSKDYSPRQLADIYRQLCVQLSQMQKEDIPFCYLEMMDEFKAGLINLKVQI